MCFFQLIEIPMGSEPASFMADLFLYIYEKKWLLQTKKMEPAKGSFVSNIFRFIGDLCTFSNDELENSYNDIYPDELKLKRENEDL